MTLRERVLRLAHDSEIGIGTRENLAFAVAQMVAEECARECDYVADDPGHMLDRTDYVATACAKSIRKLAEGLA